MDSHNSRVEMPKPAGGGVVRIGVIVIVLIFVGLYLFGLMPKLKNGERLEALAQTAKKGAVEVLVKKPFFSRADALILPASVSAIEETTLNSRVTGYLKKRYVDIGDHVKAGQVIAEIESPDVDQSVSQAMADESKAKVVVSQSESDVVRLNAGIQQAQSDIVRQKASLSQSRSQVLSAKAKVDQAKAASAQAEAAYEKSTHTLLQQRANLEQATSQLNLAQATNKRFQNLFKQGFIAQQDADDKAAALQTASSAVKSATAGISAAQSDVNASLQTIKASQATIVAAQSDVLSAEENVKALEAAVNSAQAAEKGARASVVSAQRGVQVNQSAVNSSRANTLRNNAVRSYQTIVAPFDGTITSRNVDVGSLITPGSTTMLDATTSAPKTGLFGIARTDTLRVIVQVPQSSSSLIKAGDKAEVIFREFPGKTVEGNVSFTSGALDANSRSLTVEVRISNPTGKIKPGMYAQVKFDTSKVSASVRIPASTLMVNAQGTQVVEVRPDNTLHFIPIKIGRDFGKDLEIAFGLTGKESLVSDPSDDLAEGMKVSASPAPVETDKAQSKH